ncbi:hypothetical protein ES332_D08G118700v1 [Gossypium tomentosum]|uniref:Uncharacterized protein n=1 Tax=Gossypium tomentosum TaxID=34277 RepID=A0A5D2JTY3_GOSTO|nr:hypothetical protein ES332_D08G118700v1 [Gossypium tomentosum]
MHIERCISLGRHTCMNGVSMQVHVWLGSRPLPSSMYNRCMWEDPWSFLSTYSAKRHPLGVSCIPWPNLDNPIGFQSLLIHEAAHSSPIRPNMDKDTIGHFSRRFMS